VLCSFTMGFFAYPPKGYRCLLLQEACTTALDDTLGRCLERRP
jgi:hypothetical protein